MDWTTYHRQLKIIMNWKKDVNKLPSVTQIIKKVKQLKEIKSEIVLQCVSRFPEEIRKTQRNRVEREVEGGSGWGIHVNPWLIHVNVWQKPLQYCKVISLQLIKINGKKKKKKVRQMQYSKTTRHDDSSGSRLVHHKQGKLKKTN